MGESKFSSMELCIRGKRQERSGSGGEKKKAAGKKRQRRGKEKSGRKGAAAAVKELLYCRCCFCPAAKTSVLSLTKKT
jgi:hypothetical protein